MANARLLPCHLVANARLLLEHNMILSLLKRRSHSTGLFKINELKGVSGFEKLEQVVYRECDALIKETTSDSRSRKIVEILDDVSNSICKVADLAECMRNLHPDKRYILAAEQCMARLSSFVESLNTNAMLHETLKRYGCTEGDGTDKRVSALLAEDFEASGVHLPVSLRSRFVDISEKIFLVGAEFSRGCELPTKLADTTRKSFFGNHALKTDNNQYIYGNLADSSNANQRSLGYRLFYAPSEQQESYLKQLVSLRHQLAQTCGFKSYAHRALRGSLLDQPETVEYFLRQVIDHLKPKAKAEIDQLRSLVPNETDVAIWDLPYLKSQFRAKRLLSLSQKLDGRFGISSMLSGIKLILNRLYGIDLRQADCEDGEVWHEDVEKFETFDRNGNFCGTIYCDWFDRPNKTASDSHFTVKCSKRLPNEQHQTPIVVLSFHYSKHAYSGTSYLSFGELTNVLHEFGHAMHSVLGQTKYQHVAGTRCPTDLAEVPSNLMEFYLSHPKTISSFAIQSNDANNFCSEEIRTIIECLNSFCSIDTLQQAVYALFDLKLHSDAQLISRPSLDTCQLFDDLCNEAWPFMKVTGTAWHHRFSHLVPYGCKYHSYLVARAVASLIWRQLFLADPLNTISGENWRQMQSFGGELPSKDLLQMLLGKTIHLEDLSQSLLNTCSS